MTLLAALSVLAALATPHALRLETAAPGVGAAVWLSSLAVRALVCIYAALFVVFYLPSTDLYAAISHWCWHGVLPLVATHLRFTGHSVGDIALLGPVAALAASLGWAGVGVFRVARAVRRLLKRLAVGDGPGESLIVRDGQIVIAAAGLRRPRLIVSAGALIELDDEELAAGLDHERGHIAHRHRYAMLASETLAAVARFLPGTRRAQAELLFHLERDADQYALARNHDPACLASAICKAAESSFAGTPAMAMLGGSAVVRRLRVLLDGPRRRRFGTAAATACATALTTLALAGALALPTAAQAGIHAAQAAGSSHVCPQ